ncbi:hypothetical protein PAHAL_8G211200 [Panicum hallii]|uniref:Uncharacterized protein n=1 Tax=Panicum hallii TaxID=206008 RepID=A0A2T8I9P3_9POAL|nr:hypothetical protein PAHAL_8G211200 [Panicum hallii]
MADLPSGPRPTLTVEPGTCPPLPDGRTAPLPPSTHRPPPTLPSPTRLPSQGAALPPLRAARLRLARPAAPPAARLWPAACRPRLVCSLGPACALLRPPVTFRRRRPLQPSTRRHWFVQSYCCSFPLLQL